MEHVTATPSWAMLAYLVSGVLFILALRGLSSPGTSRAGNRYGMIGMTIAVATTLVTHSIASLPEIIVAIAIGGAIGFVTARKIAMTDMPQLVAAFHSLVGLAAVLVGLAAYLNPVAFGITGPDGLIEPQSRVEMGLGIAIGAITFSGSVIAFLKLAGKMSGSPILLPGRHVLNLGTLVAILGLVGYFTQDQAPWVIATITVLSFLSGFLLISPIGGADMPVVVSMLNSYSGLAACAAGFIIGNTVLVVAGCLVGASGLILTRIMCKAMNRSLANVLFSGFGAAKPAAAIAGEKREAHPVSAEDAYYLLESARSLVVVPGYGMAVAQAQHAVRELGDLLEAKGCEVKYAIHPVAGRMPGHMNVLLAEANVSYDKLVEPGDVNPAMGSVDVVIVIGANDVVNPAAIDDPSSPIYGMPIIHAHEAKTCIVLKRSMAAGFAGIENPLFFRDNVRMLFGDAKASVAALVAQLKETEEE